MSISYPVFDFMYLFDQYSDHTKVRDDGLILYNMNVVYRGAAYSIRYTVLLEVGSYPALLSIDSCQHMSFGDSDQESFWIDAQEQLFRNMMYQPMGLQ